MKKTLLLITLLVFSLSFSQLNNKNIQTWTESNNTIITNTNNSQLGGDEFTVWEGIAITWGYIIFFQLLGLIGNHYVNHIKR